MMIAQEIEEVVVSGSFRDTSEVCNRLSEIERTGDDKFMRVEFS